MLQATHAFHTLIADLREHWRGDVYEGELYLLRDGVIKNTVNLPGAVRPIMRFVMSSDFLYTPTPVDQLHTLGSLPFQIPRNWSTYNRALVSKKFLAAAGVSGGGGGVSRAAVREVVSYYKAHGCLPAEIAAEMH